MSTRLRTVLWILFISFLFPYGPEAKAQSTIQVVKGHPRLFITQNTIPTLKERAATTHRDTYGVLKTWCDQNWNNAVAQQTVFTFKDDRDYDAGILRYALIFLLGEVPGFSYAEHSINDYGDKAVSIMLSIAAAHPKIDWTALMQFQHMAVAYDWVNTRLSIAQKQALVSWFRNIAGDVPALGNSKGYRFTSTPYSFYPGLAIYGDGINDDLAQAYVGFIPKYLESAKEISHGAGEDGGHSTGLCYAWYGMSGSYNMGKLPQDFYALKTAANLSLNETFYKYPYMNNFPIWLLYGIQPGPASPHTWGNANAIGALAKWEDCGSWHWNVEKNDYPLIQVLRLMAQVAMEGGDLNKGKLITWMINERFQAPKLDTTWDIIFNDRKITGTSPDALGTPKVKAFGWREAEGKIDYYLDNPKAGLGHVYMKNSWDFGASTTQGVFKAPPYYYFGHQHFDSLAFSIFKGEPLALANSGKYYYHYEGDRPDNALGGDSVGYPHQWYYYERTAAANSLLIMDPEEKISLDGSASTHIFKDGGQKTLLDGTAYWGEAVEGGKRDWGGLIKHEDTLEYTYSSADATKGYNSIVNGKQYLTFSAKPKVSLVQRDFVYLKSPDGNDDYFVVFDRIEPTNPSFRKVFLLHTIGEPILNGYQFAIYGNEKNGLFQSEDSNSFAIRQNKARLFMKTLLPSSTKVYKMGGKVMTKLTQGINSTDGITFQGPKINLSVNSTAEFPEKPVVVIDNEAFMCEGKTATQLIGCIRGKRYFKLNYPQVHTAGAAVVQEYAWMIREGDTGNWIAYPHDYGEPHNDNNIVKDADEYGRWALRIETVTDEIHSNFLHVLHPTVDMAKTSMVEVITIDAVSGNMKGALIKEAINPRIVMFSPTTAQISDVTYAAVYSGTGKHLITGLVPAAAYDVSKDGSKIVSKTASSQGIISFESAGGGAFRLVQTSGPIAPASDATPPSTPNQLTATAISSNQIKLSWSPSADDVGVAGYRVYRNGIQISVSATNSYSDTALAPSTTYSYTVSAYDGAFNVSSQSAPASVSTQAGTDPTPPVRYNASPTGTLPAGTTQVTLSLGTDETATCKYSTAAGVSYASMTNVFSFTRGASHSTIISNLSNGGAYNYYVRCMDLAGNINTDDYRISFSCGSSPQPSPAPAPPPPTPSGYVVNDFTFYPTPDIPKPAKGVPFKEPTFNTSITRITDALTDTGAKVAHPGYPKHNIENADGTMLVIQSYKWPAWHLWNANPPFNKIKDLPPALVDDKDPDVRWDNEDPAILYSTFGTKLLKYNVVTGQITLLHDFKEDFPGEPVVRVYTSEEGDASDDRRYWAFVARCYDANRPKLGLDSWYNTALIVYDKDFYEKDKGKIIAKLAKSDPKYLDPNFISMSPSGKYVHVGAPPSYIYPRDFSTVLKIDTHGHVDLAVDDTGREVLIWVGQYYGPTGMVDYGYWFVMADIETGEKFWLAPFGKAQLFHASGNAHDKPGWGLVSSYNPLTCGTALTQWSDASIMIYELTRRIPKPSWDNHARVWRIAHTHMCRKNYGDDPFAKMNKKGTKVWFGSGWGQSNQDPGAQYDVYQIDLPGNWFQDLMGNLPPTASLSASALSGKAPLTVKFTGSGKDADGTIASYGWYFGDGKTSAEQNPSHTYEVPGSYIITLRATDDKGATGSASVTVNVLKSDTDPLKPMVSPPTDLRILRAQ